jgi:hypothetical protein
MRLVRSLALALLLAAPAVAGDGGDVLLLKDGRKLEGSVVAETPEGVTFRSGGTTRFYAADQVAKAERGAAPAPVPAPAGDGPAAKPGDPAPVAKAPKEKRPKAMTDESRQWIRDLAARARTQDEIVRRSIAAALHACGPAAAPTILEAAAAEQDPAAKAFLESVAADLTRKGDRRDGPPTAKPGGDREPDPAMGGDRTMRPLGKGGLFDRLAAELELRDDQRASFAGVLLGMEKARGQAVRELEGGGTLESARGKLADAKKTVLDGAKGVLDAGQLEAFEPIAERHFHEMENRLAKLAAKKAPPPPEGTPPEPAK